MTLLNNPQIHKVKDLSQWYKVSTRTIRNDLSKISDWINEQPGCHYNSEAGKGIWLSFTSNFSRKRAIDSLQSIANEEDAGSQYLNPTKRKWKILSKLIFSNDYFTGKDLADLLNVSVNTFLSDLNNAKEEAQKFELNLIGKNYYGYLLDGSEINRRALMEYILQKQLDKYSYGSHNLMDMISKIIAKSVDDEYIPKEINKLINYIALILSDNLNLKKSLNSNFDLNVTKSMINRLTIIVFENRRRKNLEIFSYDKELNSTQEWYIQIYRQIIETFKLRTSEDEEKYFIFGVKVLEKDVEINQAVKEIVAYVSKEMNLPLNNDLQLQDSLTQHLINELNSNYQHFNDYTPFTDEVKNRFSKLFNIVKEALKKYISKSPIIIDDTFTTLVALHFLVSISDMKKIPQIQVLYVCSSGLGATKLLEKVVQGKIPYITTAGFASVMNYKFKIRDLAPDIVISIFPLEKVDEIPIIQVNPIPNEKDLSIIDRVVSELINKNSLSKGIHLKNTIKKEQSISNAEKVLSLSLESYIEINEYLTGRISKKYEKAFMIHVQLTTTRVYFGKQYDIKPSDKQISKFLPKDIDKLHKIYRGLDLEINISEIVAILRYTLLK